MDLPQVLEVRQELNCAHCSSGKTPIVRTIQHILCRFPACQIYVWLILHKSYKKNHSKVTDLLLFFQQKEHIQLHIVNGKRIYVNKGL